MEFETVQIGNAHYVIKNGVMGTSFALQVAGRWCIFVPVAGHSVATPMEALAFLAEQMDDWYTAAQAADRLVEMGVFDKASAHDVCRWARDGLLPGSVKITGKGGAGQGGSWRIPASALEALAERRGR